MLGLEPLQDPLGRVPLLLGPLLVFFQNSVDDTLPGPPAWAASPVSAADTQAARNNPASPYRLPRYIKNSRATARRLLPSTRTARRTRA